MRGDEQPLGHRDRSRGLVLLERLRDRPPLAPGRDRLLHPPGRARIRRSPGRSSRSSTTSTRRRPIAASTTSTAPPIRPNIAAGSTWATSTATASTSTCWNATARPTRPKPAARFPAGQRLLVHAGRAEDRPRRLPLHPRLVRPLSLLPGRQPRPRRHRPAQGAALPRALQGDAAASRVRPGQVERRRADRVCWAAPTSTIATSRSGS